MLFLCGRSTASKAHLKQPEAFDLNNLTVHLKEREKEKAQSQYTPIQLIKEKAIIN